MEIKQNHKQYTCPMHPEVKSETPGICPECGMNLVKVDAQDLEPKEESAHDRHAGLRLAKAGYGHAQVGHSTNMFKTKFWVSLLLSIPLVAYSDVMQAFFHWNPPNFPGLLYVEFLIASIVFFYGGWVFIASAWREIKGKLPGMMTLISLAIITAYIWSVYAVVAARSDVLFWELSTLITIMLLGHWLEMRAVSGAQGALKELSKLLPDSAEVIRGDKTEVVPLADLRVGDIIFVRPGGRIPADGAVVEGQSEANEAMITGESALVSKQIGDQVIAGTVNGDGALKIKVTKIGEHTFLAGVMRLVAEAQASKSRLQILSDRAALWLTAVAVGAGVITVASWIAAGAGAAFAIERLVAVLVIACPHALGLAVPLVASISTTKAAQNGFLVKHRLALEAARNINVVLFDKTGTLTKGEYGVTNMWLGTAHNEKELLGIAASVDQNSEHVIAKAIVKKARETGANILQAKDFTRIPGNGVAGSIPGKRIYVGGEALVQAHGVFISESLKKEIETENAKGKTIIYVLADKELLGVFALADLIREESREAVKELKSMGIQIAMVTGDSEGVAKWVAKELSIDHYYARVLPGEKAGIVKQLQNSKRFQNSKFKIQNSDKRVAFVGDGINDAPALTQADLGVAIGAGTNVAIESAGIILVRNDPRDIAKIIKLSRLTYTKMIQNLFWAAGYNVIAIPLAAGILASRGILLQPAVAAIFMSASTVIVAVNAITLKMRAL